MYGMKLVLAQFIITHKVVTMETDVKIFISRDILNYLIRCYGFILVTYNYTFLIDFKCKTITEPIKNCYAVIINAINNKTYSESFMIVRQCNMLHW